MGHDKAICSLTLSDSLEVEPPGGIRELMHFRGRCFPQKKSNVLPLSSTRARAFDQPHDMAT